MDADDDAENHQLIIDEIPAMISNTKYLNKLELTISMDNTPRFNIEFHGVFLEAIGANRTDFVLELTLEGRRGTKHLFITKNRILNTDDGMELSAHELSATEND